MKSKDWNFQFIFGRFDQHGSNAICPVGNRPTNQKRKRNKLKEQRNQKEQQARIARIARIAQRKSRTCFGTRWNAPTRQAGTLQRGCNGVTMEFQRRLVADDLVIAKVYRLVCRAHFDLVTGKSGAASFFFVISTDSSCATRFLYNRCNFVRRRFFTKNAAVFNPIKISTNQ